VLVKALLGLHLSKDPGARFSDWDKRELDELQKQYAALDVYASYEVMQRVLDAPDPRVC
jgi:ribonuclease D